METNDYETISTTPQIDSVTIDTSSNAYWTSGTSASPVLGTVNQVDTTPYAQLGQLQVAYDQLHGRTQQKQRTFRPDPGPFDFGVLSDVLKYGVPLNTVNKDLKKAVRHLQLLERSGMYLAAHQLREKYEMEIRTKAVKAGKYVTIKQDRIQKYLDEMAKRYNNHYDNTKTDESPLAQASGLSFGISSSDPKIKIRPTIHIDSNTNWRDSTDPKRVGIFRWEEVDTQAYQGIPPVGVLEKLQTEKKKKIFNYFTIANVKHIPDPILFGRIDGCPDRFYLAQSGDDVCLDDLI